MESVVASLWSSFCTLSSPPDAAAAAVARAIDLISHAAIKQENLVREGAAYVMSTDDSIRSKACQFLAQVIEGLPADTMQPSEGSVWLTFFITKLSDEPCARHALHALAAVCATKCALAIDSVGQLPIRVCDTIHVPSQLQPSRYHALSIFKRVLTEPSVIPQPASRVVECLVTSIDAERDPRNLLLVFELVQSVASTPAIHPLPTSLVEELFNATFRYFPIRFKKASADLGAVSSEALALKLRDALFSSTIFAPFLFMGLSQRIVGEDEDDDVIAALQCLNLSFKAFPASALVEHCDSLWGTLSHAAVDSASDKVAQACRDSVTSLLAAATVTTKAVAMTNHAVSVASSAIRRPEDDESRRTFRVFMCLIAAAESSDSAVFNHAACSAVSEICSLLADAFLSAGPRPHAQLHVVNMALELAHALSTNLKIAAALPPSVAEYLRDTFVSALTVPSNSEMALSAASGISLLVTSRIVTGTAATDAFTMLCDLAADAKGPRSHVEVRERDNETVPLYLHACRLIACCINGNSCNGGCGDSSSSSVRERFEILCKSRVIPAVAAELCAALNAQTSPDFSAVSGDNTEAAGTTPHQLSPIVGCIVALCRCSSLVPAVVASFMTDLIQKLQCSVAAELMMGMQAASGDDAGVAEGLFTDMVLPCCRALSHSRRRELADETSAGSFVTALSSLAAKCMRMSRDQLASLVALYTSLGIDSSFCELPSDSNVLIVTSCIASLAPETHRNLPVVKMCILLANSSMLVAATGAKSLCCGAGAAVGSLVNKCDESVSVSAATAAFDVLYHRASTQIQSNGAAQGLAWIVRGLMARGHASVAEFESRLQQLLDSGDGDRALAAAASYSVLVNDGVEAVSASSAAICVLLWQQPLQRYFNSSLASLLLMRSTRPSNGAILVAIAALCSSAPGPVLEPELPSVAGLIVESLKTMRGSIDVLDGTLQLLQGVLSSQSAGSSGETHVLRPHAATLVTSLLDIAVASIVMRCVSHLLCSHLQQQCPACVCSAGPASSQALDCVLDIPSNIPYAALFPYKKLVTKALMQLLEHKKRAVRRRAGVARNVWMCLST